MSQLSDLARPFPERLVSRLPPTATRPALPFVAHAHIVEKLLYVLGPFSFAVDEIIYEGGHPRGCLATLTATVDGQRVAIREVGEGHLKDAASDALKRCAMRIGVGLDLWAKGDYTLHTALTRREDDQPAPTAPDSPAPAPGDHEEPLP